jgi:dCMP deaminase
MNKRPEWDTLFMSLAFLVSQRSPDEQTKVGSILVDENHRILSLGFNGFPRGCKDANLPATRPDKYFYIIHAESNCLMNASVINNPNQCTMYVTAKPCSECTKQIIQYGIGNIVYGPVKFSGMDDPQYLEKMDKMLDGTKLNFVEFDSNNAKLADMLELLDSVKSDINLSYPWRG